MCIALVPRIPLLDCTHDLVDVQFVDAGKKLAVYLKDRRTQVVTEVDYLQVFGYSDLGQYRSYDLAPHAFVKRDGYRGWYPTAEGGPYSSIGVDVPMDIVFQVIDLG